MTICCWILISIAITIAVALLALGVYMLVKKYGGGDGPTALSAFQTMALTAAPGTGVLDMYPNLPADGSTSNIDWYDGGKMKWPPLTQDNADYLSNVYYQMIIRDFTKLPKSPLDCTDIERQKLLSYLMGVYYAMNPDNLQRLSTDDLTAFYRSLVWYYITTQDTQPDGGWYGDWWGGRINDDGPNHDKNTGKTNMTARRNESFLFDQKMNTVYPDSCPGYQTNSYGCPPHTKFWGNRIFPEMSQSTLRRGMRNSPQVLAENPPWATNGKVNPRYGTGGFPKNSYVELAQFPQEHSGGGWPTGCDATTSSCQLKDSTESYRSRGDVPMFSAADEGYPAPLYQPDGKNRNAGGDPYCGMKPQWFYFVQGMGQFWNIAETSYCYSYPDIFLNAPMGTGPNASKDGTANPVGWGNGYGNCTQTLPFPPGSGVLGYDLEDPTQPTEHDYNDMAYSMKLLLEFLSRVDVPGACSDDNGCYPGLKDYRTGMMGIGYCAQGDDGNCPCADQTGDDRVSCLNKSENSGGCGASQPVNDLSYAMHEQVAYLMGLRAGRYWKPYMQSGGFDISDSDLNDATGVDGGDVNEYGGFDANPAWAAVRVKNCPASAYPTRDSYDVSTGNYDNRQIITGWVNGNFYGYPKGVCLNSDLTPSGSCGGDSCYCNAFADGIPGVHPTTGEVIYGWVPTEDDPLIYYGPDGKELMRTWPGKKLELDEDTALRVVAEFYSCGDSGFENKEMNWPFGQYFGYGQALGTPGKSACQQLACYPYEATSTQFTFTPTSYSNTLTQPAYDFELLYAPPINPASSYVSSAKCTCATAVTLDLTADFDSKNAGADLKRYLCLNKGSTGGYVPVDSPAGQTAVAFQGQNMGVTNWTTLDADAGTGTFDPTKANDYGVNSDPSGMCGL